jgi:hypothetical protein
MHGKPVQIEYDPDTGNRNLISSEFTIGNLANSETTFPNRLGIDGKQSVYDTPGNSENRGFNFDVTNNMFLNTLFTVNSMVKVVFVLD